LVPFGDEATRWSLCELIVKC